MPRVLLVLVCIAIAAMLGGVPLSASDAPALAVAGPAGLLRTDDAPIADPFPILRIRPTEAQLPEALKQLDTGPLVRLPRSDFESRVRAAGRAAADARVLPRITDARFKAALVGGDLVGTAELDIVNPASTPRFLPLDPLRLALGPATWADGRDAIVGIPPGGAGPAIWVDRSDRQTLRFAWSLAGVVELGERHFELRVPSSPNALLNLELPAGQLPSAPASDALLTGPFPVKDDSQRSEWQFRFGGRPRLDFAIRFAGTPGAVAAAALVAKYDFTLGQMACGFEYDLRPAKGTVGEWQFTVDSGLRISDVVVNNRAGWVLDPPATPGGPRRLRVTLHQPGAGGKVLVSAIAPFPDPSRPLDGKLPIVRPDNANLDDEILELRLAPGLKIDNWNPGDYRLTDTQVLADQSRSLSLIGTLLPPGADRPFRHTPQLHLSQGDAEFNTVELVSWRFDAARALATVRIGVRVRRGALFQFSLREPPFQPGQRDKTGYAFLRVHSPSDELIAHTATAAGAVTVEFARPLVAGQSADLTFEFQGPQLAGEPFSLPFPAFLPVGAVERVGVLAIEPSSLWTLDAVSGVGALPAAWFDFTEPRAPASATAAYRFRGASPDGLVNLTPVRAEFSAENATRVVPSPGTLFGTTTFALHVRTGGFTSLLIVEAEGGASHRKWRVADGQNAIEAAVALPAQSLGQPLGHSAGWPGRFAVARAAKAPGRVWFVRFARPVTGNVTLETTATRVLPHDATPEVINEATDAFARWLVPAATRDPNSFTPGGTATSPTSPPRVWNLSGLYLVTAVRSPSDVVVMFGGTVDTSAGTSLPLRLPAGAQVRAAGVAGRWLEPGNCRISEEGVLRLPMPPNGPVRFEVRYRLPVAANRLVSRVHSPDPSLPTEGSIQRWWVFATDVLPGWPIRAWDRGGVADLPNFLGDSPVSWAGGLVVSLSPIDEVRVGSARLANVIGFAVAAGLFALAWAGGRRGHPYCGLLMFAVLLAIGCVSLLGPPWWQRATSIPLLVGLIAAAGMVVVRGNRVSAPVALALGLVSLAQVDLQAQPSTPALVVILPPDAEGRETVVAPKSVLDRLAVAPTSPGVIFAASEYTLAADDAGARVVAKFTAHVLGEGEVVATLPLADARLDKVTVNKAPAFPAAPRPGVYTVPLSGKGRHEIEVSFAVPLGGTSPERELRFGVPECPATRITADLPASARQVQVVGRVGRRSLVDGDRVRLEAEVGAVKLLHLRWREGTGGTATVKVREGCVWELTEAGAELTACYLVRVEPGSVSNLRFDLPAELDPLAVTTRSLDAGGTAALRDWTLGTEQGAFRPLRIDFQTPVAGRLLVVLTCAPRKVIARQTVLRFPKPVLPGGAPVESDAAYGLRAKGVSVEDPGRSGVIDFAPDALTRDFGGVTELRLDPNTPLRVFRPIPGGNPELRTTLRVATEPPGASLDTVWHIGPKRADATGVVRWSGKDAPEIVEFVLPVAKLLEIRGPEVSSRSQVGARVQVWLRRPVKEGEIEWIGTSSAPKFPFDAATPRPIDMRLVADTVHLRAAEGYGIQVERDRGWTAFEAPEELISRRTSNAAAPPVRVLVAPAPRVARADQFGWLSPSRNPRASTDIPAPRPAAPSQVPATSLARREASQWVWPVSAVAGWVVAVAVLVVLLIRFPHATWPEQFGIVAGLLGAAVGGHWWAGLAAWAVVRLVLLVLRVLPRSPRFEYN